MKTYLLKRFLLVPVVLAGITFLVFLLIWALPGDPSLALVGERAKAATVESIRRELGVDRPFLEQYLGYLKLIMHGNLGRSFYTNRSVADDLIDKLPHTLALAASAMALAVPVGVSLGLFMALGKRRFERFLNVITMAGVSLPVFWVGLILMLLISVKARLLPPSGTGGFRYIILPAITLAVPAFASIARVTKTVAMDVLNQPFMLTARAKGLRRLRVVFTHLLKNTLIPVVTVIGLDFGSYLNGAVLTETIFGWDGVGRFAMEGIIKRDYPVVMGTVLVGTLAFVGINLIVDLCYAVMDPRVKKG